MSLSLNAGEAMLPGKFNVKAVKALVESKQNELVIKELAEVDNYEKTDKVPALKFLGTAKTLDINAARASDLRQLFPEAANDGSKLVGRRVKLIIDDKSGYVAIAGVD